MSKQTHQKSKSSKKKVEQHATNFGARLRSLIDGKGISLAQFAGEFGISESQLHNWLKRTAPPLEKHWKPLADYFGVSPNYVGLGTPQKMESRVEEVQSVYGSADTLGREIETEYARLRAIAGDDVGRLGWLREELRAITARASGQGNEAGVSDEAKRLIAAFRQERASWRAQMQEAAARAGRDQAAS